MVDTINSVSGVTPQTQASQSASKTTVDYESFLTLLVAQLKNQDPTEPMKSTEYMAQLASFSNVEQSVQIKDQLETMIKASYIDQGSNIIGKTVTTGDGATSGVVKEVQIFDDGIIATLESGEQVAVGSGLKITDEPTEVVSTEEPTESTATDEPS